MANFQTKDPETHKTEAFYTADREMTQQSGRETNLSAWDQYIHVIKRSSESTESILHKATTEWNVNFRLLRTRYPSKMNQGGFDYEEITNLLNSLNGELYQDDKVKKKVQDQLDLFRDTFSVTEKLQKLRDINGKKKISKEEQKESNKLTREILQQFKDMATLLGKALTQRKETKNDNDFVKWMKNCNDANNEKVNFKTITNYKQTIEKILTRIKEAVADRGGKYIKAQDILAVDKKEIISGTNNKKTSSIPELLTGFYSSFLGEWSEHQIEINTIDTLLEMPNYIAYNLGQTKFQGQSSPSDLIILKIRPGQTKDDAKKDFEAILAKRNPTDSFLDFKAALQDSNSFRDVLGASVKGFNKTTFEREQHTSRNRFNNASYTTWSKNMPTTPLTRNLIHFFQMGNNFSDDKVSQKDIDATRNWLFAINAFITATNGIETLHLRENNLMVYKNTALTLVDELQSNIKMNIYPIWQIPGKKVKDGKKHTTIRLIRDFPSSPIYLRKF